MFYSVTTEASTTLSCTWFLTYLKTTVTTLFRPFVQEEILGTLFAPGRLWYQSRVTLTKTRRLEVLIFFYYTRRNSVVQTPLNISSVFFFYLVVWIVSSLLVYWPHLTLITSHPPRYRRDRTVDKSRKVYRGSLTGSLLHLQRLKNWDPVSLVSRTGSSFLLLYLKWKGIFLVVSETPAEKWRPFLWNFWVRDDWHLVVVLQTYE